MSRGFVALGLGFVVGLRQYRIQGCTLRFTLYNIYKGCLDFI